MKSEMKPQDFESIRESDARFRAIFENAAVGIARVNSNRMFLEVNQRLCEIVGYSRQELLTKTFTEITHPEDLEGDAKLMREILAGTADTYLREKRYRRKDGSLVWVNLNVTCVRNTDGSPDYFVGIIEDISDRKQAEADVRKRDERLLLASRTAGLGIFEWDLKANRAVWENDRIFEIYGVSRSEGAFSSSKFQQQYLHPDDYNSFHEDVRSGISARGMIHTIFRIRRKDAAIRWLELTGKVQFDSAGAPATMVGVVADITERKQAEQALRDSEERFRAVADTAPVMIWGSGTDKLCTFVNKTWLDFTGRTMDSELGNGWAEAVHPDDVERCLETYTKAFDAREHFKMEYRLRRHDAVYRWLLDQGVPQFSSSGNFLGYIGSCIDISDRKDAEAERERFAQEHAARAAAEFANRAKDEFLAMVSHELRSPLNAILGYTRILRSGPPTKEAIQKNTAIVERNAKAQLQIVEDLLDSARIITGKLRIDPVPVDLLPVLEAALDTVRAAAEAKGVTLISDFDAEPEQVLADPTRLQQIVWNLLTNAIKFTPEGGRVRLRLHSTEDHLSITVSDSGKGIEPEFLPFLFDRFRQADPTSARRFSGLGLGLSLVKHLVELHGGTVTVASEGIGGGATFTVTLPRRDPDLFRRMPEAAAVEVLSSGMIQLDQTPSIEGISVLVVDDQEEAREVLRHTLNDYGAEVTTVSSSSEALAFLARPPLGRKPDVLIIDIAMPHEDGYSLLRKVRALEADLDETPTEVPAIALTAYGRSEDRLRALQAGFHMHVAKPVEPAELAVVIASLTNNRAWERRRIK